MDDINYIHTKKVKNPEINKKLLNIYDNKKNLSIKNIIDDYLEIINYILDYATKNNQQIDDANLISDFMINVIGAFEEEILNLKKDEYNLNITNQYLDKLVNTMDLDDNNY